MIVHVICCNDSVEYAVMEDAEKANAVLLKMKENHFRRVALHSGFKTMEEYSLRLYWHVHTVNGE